MQRHYFDPETGKESVDTTGNARKEALEIFFGKPLEEIQSVELEPGDAAVIEGNILKVKKRADARQEKEQEKEARKDALKTKLLAKLKLTEEELAELAELLRLVQ